MQIDKIKAAVLQVVAHYPVSRITLFGSQAAGTAKDDSDVDLIVEFFQPVSLMTLAGMKCDLEEILQVNVDLIHGPLRNTDMIEVGQEVVLYAA